MAEAAPQTDPSEDPIFLFRVGLRSGMPLGLMEAFAADIEVDGGDVMFFSRPELAASVIASRHAAGLTEDANPKRINTRLKRLAIPLLQRGTDVVADVGINKIRARKETCLRVAEMTGARLVAVNITTPIDVMRQRIQSWQDQQLPIGDDLRTFDEIQPATTAEGIHHVVNLDCTGDDVTELVEALGELLEGQGIFAMDEALA